MALSRIGHTTQYCQTLIFAGNELYIPPAEIVWDEARLQFEAQSLYRKTLDAAYVRLLRYAISK